MLLEGLHIPLTTPFHPDGRLHLHKLAANVIRYSKSPAQGLIVLAPLVGEPTLLNDHETGEVLRTVSEAATPEKVLLANVSRDSVRATLALAEIAAALSYDAVLVGAPSMVVSRGCTSGQVGQHEVSVYFRAVADSAALPVVLLSTAAAPLSAEMIADLAIHSNVYGLLDASISSVASWNSPAVRTAVAAVRHEATVTMTFTPVTRRMLRNVAAAQPSEQPVLISATSLARNPAAAATAVASRPAIPNLRTRTKVVGFQVIESRPSHLLASLGAGASAIAPAISTCAPQACYEVFAAWKDADAPLALEKQERLRAAAEFAESLGPGAHKFGCDLNGYFGGLPRSPHLPLTAHQRAELEERMASLRT
jgi:4-hydroxy-2-oxoglutarate aldolase